MHLVGVNAFVYDSWFFFIGGYGQIASIIVYSWESGYLYDIIFISFVFIDKCGSRFCQTPLSMYLNSFNDGTETVELDGL